MIYVATTSGNKVLETILFIFLCILQFTAVAILLLLIFGVPLLIIAGIVVLITVIVKKNKKKEVPEKTKNIEE